ncbi:MAG TPA: radical SAM protein [Gemmatimonadaceae bacterium]|nr:radical SAM protein [Gemmatimonadaceae bacterium]
MSTDHPFPASPLGRALDLGFELTNLCNLHCTHCIRGSHQTHIDSLDLDLIASIVDQAREMFSTIEVVFTGGEPLSSELFPKAVELLAARGVAYRFVTNGWLIPRHLPLLARYAPRLVRISLSGASRESHDVQRGRGSFRRALVGAVALMTRGIRAELSFIINRHSRAELRQAVTLVEELGIPELHFILPQPTPETAIDESDLSPDEWREATAEVLALVATTSARVVMDYGVHMPLAERRTCDAMKLRQLYVDAKGRASFCCQLSRYGTGEDPVHGDLRAESLAAIMTRASATYASFGAETLRLQTIGSWDALDDYPCLSCARRHGKTEFLAAFPAHPWAGLARSSARQS